MEIIAAILIVGSSIGVSLLIGAAMISAVIALLTRTPKEAASPMPLVPAGNSPAPVS